MNSQAFRSQVINQGPTDRNWWSRSPQGNRWGFQRTQTHKTLRCAFINKPRAGHTIPRLMNWKKSLKIWPTKVKSVNGWGGILGMYKVGEVKVTAAGVGHQKGKKSWRKIRISSILSKGQWQPGKSCAQDSHKHWHGAPPGRLLGNLRLSLGCPAVGWAALIPNIPQPPGSSYFQWHRMDRVNACRKRFSGLLVMCKLASGQLPQREMANKYLLVVSKNHSHKTLPFGCRSVCVFTETNAKGDGFISDWGNLCNPVIYCLQVTEKAT